MTVELGNINKGIPMGSYTPGEGGGGGGGTAKVTGVDPIAVTNGSVAIKIDEQTLQVNEQGELSANLDEIGSELNDLSGRVTAAEADLMNKVSKADLAAKQDKLSPIAPLGINQNTISNVTDGTFLTDTSVIFNSAFDINYTTDANARILIYAKEASGVGATPTSFIQIPFTLGDLISFPFEKNTDSDIGLVFGYWKEGLFYPTMLYKTYITYGSGSNCYAPFAFVSEAGKSSLEKIATYYGQSNAISKSILAYNASMPLNATNYIQVTKNVGVPTVNMWFTINGASYPNAGYTQRMYTSDTTVLENFNKTNVCLLLSYDTSKAINLTKVTRRELGDTVLNPTADALTTALSTYSNSFDATAKVTTNDLSLAIGSGLAITDGKLTASSTAPANMVTTNTSQDITANKTFKSASLTFYYNSRPSITIANNQSTISMAYDGDTSADSSNILRDTSSDWRVGRYNKQGVIGSSTPLERMGAGPYFNRYPILDSSNLGSYVDGTTITYSGNKLSAVGGGSTSVEKYGIEGDYSSKYGILECPNGIFTVSDMTMTLQPGVVMQCAGSEAKTTNSSAMTHTVTSTSDFDIFYTSGQFIEATQVVFSTEEPENGATGYLAWWDPSRADKKWQFKSNDSGNVWAAAPACRLAHVHTDGTTITRVDYIGNRQMDDGCFADLATANTFKKALVVSVKDAPYGDPILQYEDTTGTKQTVIYAGDSGVFLYKIQQLDITGTETPTVSLGDYLQSGIGKLQFKGYKSNGSTYHYNGVSFNYNVPTMRYGDNNAATVIEGSSVQDSNGKDFLTGSNVASYVIETHKDGSSGYRLWSDGYYEEWGIATPAESTLVSNIITLTKAYADTNYQVQLTQNSPSADVAANAVPLYRIKSTTEFYYCLYGAKKIPVSWKTSGYIS
nr:MAG TPA: fiber protein [Caudoviricetes sp.]